MNLSIPGFHPYEPESYTHTMTLWSELKRRRVFRVAAMYGITAWIIIEVSATVLPALNLPEQFVTGIVVLLIAGFPITLILAWIFDINPEGISRTDTQPTTPPVSRSLKYRAAYTAVIVAATICLGAFFFWRLDNPPAPEPVTSIAVLPFTNLSADSSTDYFSDGVSEELLNLLTKVPGLKVAARTSSFAYKDQDTDIRAIGRELRVDAVLEGSVRWSQNNERVRITAQLIDTTNGYHLWSETYDRELADIFVVQDEIARAIVARVKPNLAGSEQTAAELATAPTQDIDAYTFYLRGRALWKQRGHEALKQAIELFQISLSHDPGFARAYSNLAAAYVVMPGYSKEPVKVLHELAVDAAVKALTIDESLAEAHAVLARVYDTNWTWNDALTGFYFATSLDPTEPTAHLWYSMHLSAVGRLNLALEHAREAARLDPDDAAIQAHLAFCLALAGLDTESAEARNKAKTLGFVDNPADPTTTRLLALSAANELDTAFELASEMVEARTLPLKDLWDKQHSSFRQDQRFTLLMTEIGLIDYWRRYGWADACNNSPGRESAPIECS